MKIFEKLGVTNNSDDIINSISFNISKVILSEIPYFNVVKGIEDYQNLKFEKTKYGNQVTFYIDKKHNTCLSWLSNDTKIKVNNIICNEYEYEILKSNKDFMTYSEYKLKNDKIVGYFEFTFFHVFDEHTDDIPNVYFYNKRYTYNQLKSIVQHELNHVHKNTKIKRDIKYNEAYQKLVDIFSVGNSITSQIAYILYVTCIQDERNAHVEQFYREVENKDPNTSDIWKKINKFSDNLKFFEYKLNNGLDKNIYSNLKNICLELFNIKSNDPSLFCQKLFKFIKFNINKTKRLMLRTLSLYEDEDDIFYNRNIRY